MSKIDLVDVARQLGMKTSEVLDAEDSPAGLVVRVFDGTTLVHVPDDAPDGAGKTGWMYLTAPDLPGDRVYTGDAPVYTQPADEQPGSPAAADGEYPAKGNANAVLAWVAGDEERAREAYDVEIKAKKPRSGLVDELTAILAQYATEAS